METRYYLVNWVLNWVLTPDPKECKRLAEVDFPIAGVSAHAAREKSMRDDHPSTPHLYLSVLGVDPPRQGQGVGSRLIAPGLELCDREGVPAYLETARERNVVFYERHGFRVTHELTLPRGPRLWLLWREPR